MKEEEKKPFAKALPKLLTIAPFFFLRFLLEPTTTLHPWSYLETTIVINDQKKATHKKGKRLMGSKHLTTLHHKV